MLISKPMRLLPATINPQRLAQFFNPAILEDDVPRSQAMFALKIAMVAGMVWTLVFSLVLLPFTSNLAILLSMILVSGVSFTVNLRLIQKEKLALAMLLHVCATDVLALYCVLTLTGFLTEYGLLMLVNAILVGLVLGYRWMYAVMIGHVGFALFLQHLTSTGLVTVAAQPIPTLVRLALFTFSASFLLAIVYSQRHITTKSVDLYREKQRAQRQERLLVDVVQSLDDMIVVTDSQGHITLVNHALCRALGYEQAELVGQPLSLHLDAKGGFCLHKDGRRMWVTTSTAALKDNNGQVTGMMTIVRDQTALRKAESALRIINRRYEQAMGIVKAGFFEIVVSRREVHLDSNLKQMLGIRDSSQCRDFADYLQHVHVDDIATVVNAMRSLVVSAATQVEIEIRALSASRELRWLMICATTIIDELSGERHLLGTVVDVTGQRAAREALGYRDAILSAINYAAESYLTDADWKVITPRVLARLGQVLKASRAYVFENAQSAEGRILTSQRFEWTDGKAPPQIDNPNLQNLDYESIGFGEWLVRMKHGQPVYGNVRDLPPLLSAFLRAQAIESIALMPIFVHAHWWGVLGFDFCEAPREWTRTELELLETAARILGTAIQRSQTERQRFQAAVERERMHILSSFISKAAHEFKTPLTIINTNAYLISRFSEKEAELRISKVQQIQDQVKQIDRLVEAMVLMTRLDTEPLNDLRETSLNTLVETAVYSFMPIAQSRKQTLILHPAPEIPLVHCDEIKLERAIANLIDNAIKFTPEGGTVRVSVRVTSLSQVLVEVVDTGIGMDSDTRRRLFEHFFRHDQAHSTRGLGLGLPIARRIVELHGGSISVDSHLGRGSTFTIWLPLVQVSDAPPSTVSV